VTHIVPLLDGVHVFMEYRTEKGRPTALTSILFLFVNCIFISFFLCFVLFIVTSLPLRFSFAYVLKVVTALGGKTLAQGLADRRGENPGILSDGSGKVD
jgi:hypothetical protein